MCSVSTVFQLPTCQNYQVTNSSRHTRFSVRGGYSTMLHDWHSSTVRRPFTLPVRQRMMLSDVEQKLLLPVEPGVTGLATTTKSLQGWPSQLTALIVNRYPLLGHQLPVVQFMFPS